MTRADSQGGPVGRLRAAAGGLVDALAQRAVDAARDKVENATGRLTDYVEGGAGPGLVAAVTGAKDLAEGKSPARSLLGAGVAGLKERVSGLFHRGKGKGGSRQQVKLTNIVESVDVGVPVRVAYNQWTEYSQFPTFMKKVENVQQTDDTTLNWKAQVFWSHRSWEATILRQRPDEQIVWRSKGQKGHVDGAVTFHELAPDLTRIVLIMEYHPQGLFERTGNVWRAQGRRARLELKQFARHVMTSTILHPDELEGWRGTIEDGKVVKDHDTALKEEDDATGQGDEERSDTETGGTRGRRPAPRRQPRQQASRSGDKSRSATGAGTRGGARGGDR
jgi:Polyketide cyclase / dehydrase and lipid transport